MVDPVNLMFNRKRKKELLKTNKEKLRTLSKTHPTYQYIITLHSKNIARDDFYKK